MKKIIKQYWWVFHRTFSYYNYSSYTSMDDDISTKILVEDQMMGG